MSPLLALCSSFLRVRTSCPLGSITPVATSVRSSPFCTRMAWSTSVGRNDSRRAAPGRKRPFSLMVVGLPSSTRTARLLTASHRFSAALTATRVAAPMIHPRTLVSLPMMAFWTTLDSRNKTTKSNMLRVARSRLPVSRNKIRIAAYTRTVRRIFSAIGIWTANIECHTGLTPPIAGGPGVRCRTLPASPGVWLPVGRARALAAGSAVCPMPPDVPPDRDDEADHHHPRDDVGRTTEGAGDGLPVGADRVAGVGERGDPRDGADGRVDPEPDRLHPREASGQRDEGPHHRQEAPDQDGPRAVPGEPGAGAVQVVLAQPEPVAPAAQRGLAAVSARGPREVAADDVARHPGSDDRDEVEAGPWDRTGGERTREGHDQLGGDRQARRLRHHEHEHSDVSVGGYEVLHGPAFFGLGNCLACDRRASATWRPPTPTPPGYSASGE